MSWRIEYEGAVLREREMTAGDIVIVSELSETTGWDALQPLSSPRVLVAWIALAVARTTGGDIGDVLTFVSTKPIEAMMAAISEEPDEEPAPEPKQPTIRRVG